MDRQDKQADRGLLLAILLTAALTLLILYGTLSPPGAVEAPLPLNDKQWHVLAFAALVLPLGWVRAEWVIWIVTVALLFGGMIELVQPLVGRMAEWGDFIANGIGCLIGVLPGQLRRMLRSGRR